MNNPTLTPDCFIRFRYRGGWDYGKWHPDHSYTVICSHLDIEDWRAGKPISPLIYCEDKAVQALALSEKERLRDKKVKVIHCVSKHGKWEARKEVSP